MWLSLIHIVRLNVGMTGNVVLQQQINTARASFCMAKASFITGIHLTMTHRSSVIGGREREELRVVILIMGAVIFALCNCSY